MHVVELASTIEPNRINHRSAPSPRGYPPTLQPFRNRLWYCGVKSFRGVCARPRASRRLMSPSPNVISPAPAPPPASSTATPIPPHHTATGSTAPTCSCASSFVSISASFWFSAVDPRVGLQPLFPLLRARFGTVMESGAVRGLVSGLGLLKSLDRYFRSQSITKKAENAPQAAQSAGQSRARLRKTTAFSTVRRPHSPYPRRIFRAARPFRRERIQDTVVFFGSARFRALDEANADLELPRKTPAPASPAPKKSSPLRPTTSNRAPPPSSASAARRAAVEMAHYYEDARPPRLPPHPVGQKISSPAAIASLSPPAVSPGIWKAANPRRVGSGGQKPSASTSACPSSNCPTASSRRRAPNFEFHYFFMRKYWFAYLAKALVVFSRRLRYPRRDGLKF